MDDDENVERLFPGAPDDDDVEELDDGSALVHSRDVPNAAESSHYENLAEKMSESERQEMAAELLELIEEDKKAREKRDKQYKDGLQRTGAWEPAPGGADFEGANRATHPLLLEASIDFHASAYKEIQPADGPAKIKIVGGYDRKMLDRAERIRDYMNWQMTSEIAEYEDVLDETLSQVPLAGSQYMKWWWDPDRRRPRTEFFPSDMVYIPFAESSFYETRRLTLVLDLTQGEFGARVRSGMYRDINAVEPQAPEESQAAKAAAKIEGKSPTGMNVDKVRRCYEVYIEWDLKDGDDGPAPYIVTVDEAETTILSVRRNWEEGDDDKRKMDWVIEWPFIKWRGAMSLGLIHVIGGLSIAATGALRALLDSGFINTVPSGIMLKGVGNVNAQSTSVAPGTFAKIDAPPAIDDIRKAAMPFPFNPPSPILFELLGFLTEAGKGVVSTAEEKIADASNQMPVGTTMALIEQGGKVFSAIHKRLHRACHRTLLIVYRLNRMYLTKERVIEELGSLVVRPDDFHGPSPLVPVSDPNIFSEGQRFAQMQGVMQLAMTQPGMYDMRKINERWLQLMRVPDGDDLLTKAPDPKETNPVAENMGMALGTPAAAFPLQDHLAHIQSHVLFLMDPNLGQNPLIVSGLVPLMAEHLKQHLVMAYARMMYDAGSKAFGKPLETVMKDDDEHVRVEFDRLMAVISQHVAEGSKQAFSQLLPIFQQVAEMQQKLKPPMPMDPSAVAAMDVQRQTQADQANAQAKQQDNQIKVASLDQKRQEIAQKAQADQQKQQQAIADAEAKRQADLQKTQQQTAQKEASDRRKTMAEMRAQDAARRKAVIDAEVKRQEIDAENRRAAAKIEADREMNELDNETAIKIAQARAVDRDAKVGGLTSGAGVTNPTP